MDRVVYPAQAYGAIVMNATKQHASTAQIPISSIAQICAFCVKIYGVIAQIAQNLAAQIAQLLTSSTEQSASYAGMLGTTALIVPALTVSTAQLLINSTWTYAKIVGKYGLIASPVTQVVASTALITSLLRLLTASHVVSSGPTAQNAMRLNASTVQEIT
jgi:predicted amino acid dehydrogenase